MSDETQCPSGCDFETHFVRVSGWTNQPEANWILYTPRFLGYSAVDYNPGTDSGHFGIAIFPITQSLLGNSWLVSHKPATTATKSCNGTELECDNR